MIEYKILKSTMNGALAFEVEEHLNNGWKLAGDLKIAVHDWSGGNGAAPEFYQALTKGNPNA